MKRLYLGFGITALMVIVVGLIHGGIAWIVAEATWSSSGTSLPTWAAFVLPVLFYSVVVSVVLIAWLITWLIVCSSKKRITKRR